MNRQGEISELAAVLKPCAALITNIGTAHIGMIGSRRKRIAAGSGTTVTDVNQLLKNFSETKKMMQKLTKGGIGGLGKMLR